MRGTYVGTVFFFFQAEDGIRDLTVTWSSDVCSSDLAHAVVFDIPAGIDIAIEKQTHITVTGVDRQLVGQVAANIRRLRKRSEERRVGKEGRSRWSPYH